ncbi:MAG TPA: YdiU family protein [Hyphomicrobiaceae bacterium]|nr:YdiU family protein [Hyphomicrobiaceae bacterium]
MAHFRFDNSYARLPDRFFARLDPTAVAAPRLIAFNEALARRLGLDASQFDPETTAQMLSGNLVPEGAQPLAQAYAGHQFGGFVPKLGDGRAILLGEIVAPDGARFDIQLKGSGRTPFSRGGDGRAALGPVLREYVVSEGMAALGVPTTRSLAAVATGEGVFRDVPLPGAVLTRVAASHIRVGTFQYFAVRQDVDGIRTLADHVIGRHYPHLSDSAQRYRGMLAAIVSRQARLVAQWMSIGFIHGVMNTDNMTVSGETIDYGPCAFMDTFHPAKVFSSIDRQGRYAWGNQARIASWNLARLAETLLPLLDEDETKAVGVAQEVVEGFGPEFNDAFSRFMAAKVGLTRIDDSGFQLAQDLLQAMADAEADFTSTFRLLAEGAARDEFSDAAGLFRTPEGFLTWIDRWRARLAEEGTTPVARAAAMLAANPAIIPRNHRIEEAIDAAVAHDDLAPFHRLVAAVSRPFAPLTEDEPFRQPPLPHEIVRQTFCGT